MLSYAPIGFFMAKKGKGKSKNRKPPQLSEQQVRQVADRVYGLMLVELRSDRERQWLIWDRRYLSKRL